LDYIPYYLENGQLHFLAGHDSIGKTTLALNIAYNVGVMQSKKVLFISCEMNFRQLRGSLICLSDYSSYILCSPSELNDMKDDEGIYSCNCGRNYDQFLKRIDDNIYFQTLKDRSIETLERIVNEKVKFIDFDLVVIDDIHRIGYSDKNSFINRNIEVSNIVGYFKSWALTYDIPFLSVAQVDECAKLEKRCPNVLDIRNSSVIESDADGIMIFHRPEFFGEVDDGEGNYVKGVSDLIIVKNRIGNTGEIKLCYNSKNFNYSEITKNHYGYYTKNQVNNFSYRVNANNNIQDEQYNWSNQDIVIDKSDDIDEKPFS
jgi:replicative DNA helicase